MTAITYSEYVAFAGIDFLIYSRKGGYGVIERKGSYLGSCLDSWGEAESVMLALYKTSTISNAIFLPISGGYHV